MIAVIQQALGHIHRGNACALVLQTVKDELMLAQSANGQLINILQAFLDIVGIQSCQGTYQLDVLAA